MPSDVIPQVISLDADGNFFVSDPTLSLVLLFDAEGNRLGRLPPGARGRTGPRAALTTASFWLTQSVTSFASIDVLEAEAMPTFSLSPWRLTGSAAFIMIAAAGGRRRIESDQRLPSLSATSPRLG